MSTPIHNNTSIAEAILAKLNYRKAEHYLSLLVAAPVFLGILDNLELSGLAQRKAKFHLKGLIAELEKLDPDFAGLWKADPTAYYFSMDGWEVLIKFAASINHLQLQALGRNGLEINYGNQTEPTVIEPSARSNELQTI